MLANLMGGKFHFTIVGCEGKTSSTGNPMKEVLLQLDYPGKVVQVRDWVPKWKQKLLWASLGYPEAADEEDCQQYVGKSGVADFETHDYVSKAGNPGKSLRVKRYIEQPKPQDYMTFPEDNENDFF